MADGHSFALNLKDSRNPRNPLALSLPLENRLPGDDFSLLFPLPLLLPLVLLLPFALLLPLSLLLVRLLGGGGNVRSPGTSSTRVAVVSWLGALVVSDQHDAPVLKLDDTLRGARLYIGKSEKSERVT